MYKRQGLDFGVIGQVTDVIKECVEAGVQMGIVIGGGNFWRGVKNGEGYIERTRADHMGMLATAMNCMAVADVLEQMCIRDSNSYHYSTCDAPENTDRQLILWLSDNDNSYFSLNKNTDMQQPGFTPNNKTSYLGFYEGTNIVACLLYTSYTPPFSASSPTGKCAP